jgi:hypothetical protein
MPSVRTKKVGRGPNRITETVEFICNKEISKLYREAIG